MWTQDRLDRLYVLRMQAANLALQFSDFLGSFPHDDWGGCSDLNSALHLGAQMASTEWNRRKTEVEEQEARDRHTDLAEAKAKSLADLAAAATYKGG